MEKTVAETVADLAAFLSALGIACEMAKISEPGASIELAVFAKRPDGSGLITASFEAPEFIKDVETLVKYVEGCTK